MKPFVPVFSLMWQFGSRLAWWGLRDGAFIGALIGAFVGYSVMLVPILAQVPPAAINEALFLVPLFSAAVGFPLGAFSGGVIGLLVGTITGSGIGVMTWLVFVPLTDIPQYHRWIRTTGLLLSLITTITGSLVVYNLLAFPYLILVPVLAPLITCGYTWAVTPRLLRWYLYSTKSVDEIIALQHAGIHL